MKTWIVMIALATLASPPAQAATTKHRHHAAAPLPDSVTVDGKDYKVCKAGMQDDCIEPRQAGLGAGNRPSDTAYHEKDTQHP